GCRVPGPRLPQGFRGHREDPPGTGPAGGSAACPWKDSREYRMALSVSSTVRRVPPEPNFSAACPGAAVPGLPGRGSYNKPGTKHEGKDPMATLPDGYLKAQRHLARRDPVLKRLIAAVGPCTLRYEPNGFAALVRSIISQQISTRAAASIHARLEQ